MEWGKAKKNRLAALVVERGLQTSGFARAMRSLAAGYGDELFQQGDFDSAEEARAWAFDPADLASTRLDFDAAFDFASNVQHA